MRENTDQKNSEYVHFLSSGYQIVKVLLNVTQYELKVTGKKFAKIIEEQFADMFFKGNNKKGKLFLLDGDPLQNCKM